MKFGKQQKTLKSESQRIEHGLTKKQSSVRKSRGSSENVCLCYEPIVSYSYCSYCYS